MAPPGPKSWLHSLPPILSEMPQTPISSCSKGSRGLSVWPRVLGIFTETAISPSPSLRQRPSRYAIRAGRNLPDKEFRYYLTFRATSALERMARPCVHRACPCMSPCSWDHLFDPAVPDVWRMASEDSDQLVAWAFWRFIVCATSAISISPSRCEMQAGVDERHALRELLEVRLLGRTAADAASKNGMTVSSRSARSSTRRSDTGRSRWLSCRRVRHDPSPTPKKLSSSLEAARRSGALRDRELVSYLVAGPVAAATRSVCLAGRSRLRSILLRLQNQMNPASR